MRLREEEAMMWPRGWRRGARGATNQATALKSGVTGPDVVEDRL